MIIQNQINGRSERKRDGKEKEKRGGGFGDGGREEWEKKGLALEGETA